MPLTHVSHTYALILNLRAAAEHHKAHCDAPCNVDLHSLKQAAETIVRYAPMPGSEVNAIRKLLKDWPL